MRRVFHYSLIGPVLGACLGMAQVAVAASVWVSNGRPDFYFRGWGAVERGLLLWSVGGALAGILFATVVVATEWVFGRQLRTVPAFAGSVVAASMAALVLTEAEFARRELLPAFTHEGVSAAIAGLCLRAWSEKSARVLDLQPENGAVVGG